MIPTKHQKPGPFISAFFVMLAVGELLDVATHYRPPAWTHVAFAVGYMTILGLHYLEGWFAGDR